MLISQFPFIEEGGGGGGVGLNELVDPNRFVRPNEQEKTLIMESLYQAQF